MIELERLPFTAIDSRSARSYVADTRAPVSMLEFILDTYAHVPLDDLRLRTIPDLLREYGKLLPMSRPPRPQGSDPVFGS